MSRAVRWSGAAGDTTGAAPLVIDRKEIRAWAGKAFGNGVDLGKVRISPIFPANGAIAGRVGARLVLGPAVLPDREDRGLRLRGP